ncbi:6-phosphogluconolactonase [Rhabdochromatium marinum]|nr:6-phosphogluconolactonase [Rhabdochromatium marinum]
MHWPGADSRMLPDAPAVAAAAADIILQQALAALAARNRFHLVLAGGSTPVAVYRLLAQVDQDWSGWRFYLGDERCLPPDDPERNSRMAREAWLEPAGIAAQQCAEIPAELGPEAAAQAYAPQVAEALPFDLVLLGMGEDGHTASLFPGLLPPERGGAQETDQEDPPLVMAVRQAPKPPPERVSLTPYSLGASRCILMLVTGAAKHSALRAWQRGEDLPIARVAARSSKTLLLLDQAAAQG